MIFLPKAPQSVVRHFALRFAANPNTPNDNGRMPKDNRQNVKWVEVGIRKLYTKLLSLC
jgi:hypothetical protein